MPNWSVIERSAPTKKLEVISPLAPANWPSPPSTRTGNPIPPALERLVMECLAKSPDARPQSARELAGRLALIEGGAVWRVERAPLWWQEHFPEPPSPSLP